MALRGDPTFFNAAFLDAIFGSRTAQTGGVVKRSALDVQREVGEHKLVEAVKRRGFQLHRTEHHYVITCNGAPIQKLV